MTDAAAFSRRAASARPLLRQSAPEPLDAVAAVARPGPAGLRAAARSFRGARPAQVADVLHTPVALGQAHGLPGDRFAA